MANPLRKLLKGFEHYALDPSVLAVVAGEAAKPYASAVRRRLPKQLAVVKLDIDRKRKPSMQHIDQLLSRAGYGILDYECMRSPGGNGWHVYLWLDPAPRTPMEVIALQAVLGSDPQREACNLLRARKMWRTPAFARSWFNVLYRSASSENNGNAPRHARRTRR